ncbi:MAG: YbjN domain-containing protein [Pirellulales bacterium]|nr:YbjN domain-containing protein [Pirellulales bacterium]
MIENAKGSTDQRRLDAEKLEGMLKGMGYEPVVTTLSDGTVAYKVTEKVPGGTFVLRLNLSKDKKNLWIIAFLGKVPVEREIPSDILIKMLDHNYRSTFMKFSYITPQRQFVLEGIVPNEGVAPALLRKLIQESLDMLPKTSKLWWPEFWPVELSAGEEETQASVGG